MRYARKVDANQAGIVEALRGIPECSVLILSSVGDGCPDLLVGYHGANLLVELKNPERYPVIAQEFPLAQAARSHEAVMEAGHHGKVVLIP